MDLEKTQKIAMNGEEKRDEVEMMKTMMRTVMMVENLKTAKMVKKVAGDMKVALVNNMNLKKKWEEEKKKWEEEKKKFGEVKVSTEWIMKEIEQMKMGGQETMKKLKKIKKRIEKITGQMINVDKTINADEKMNGNRKMDDDDVMMEEIKKMDEMVEIVEQVEKEIQDGLDVMDRYLNNVSTSDLIFFCKILMIKSAVFLSSYIFSMFHRGVTIVG